MPIVFIVKEDKNCLADEPQVIKKKSLGGHASSERGNKKSASDLGKFNFLKSHNTGFPFSEM